MLTMLSRPMLLKWAFVVTSSFNANRGQVRRMRAEEMHTLFIDYTHFEKFSE